MMTLNSLDTGNGKSKLASLGFAGGALTPPLTKGMLHAPLEPQYKVPHPKGGA